MRLGLIIMSQRIKLSRQWVGPGSPRPKKFKTQPSVAKVMDTVFWDAKGVIMLDFLPKRSTITGVYYPNLLDQLRTAIREKRRGKLSKGVLLQHDNAGVHTCKVAMDAVERNGYELVPHPAYSPDLASYSQTWKRISVDFISGLMKKSWRQLRSGSMERTLTFSILDWWHLNTAGSSAVPERRMGPNSTRDYPETRVLFKQSVNADVIMVVTHTIKHYRLLGHFLERPL